MTIEEIRNYCLNKKGATEELPFDENTLVFKIGNKIFLLLSLNRQPLYFSVKTQPEWSEELREQYPQITGAYHMNKKHWNSVMCEGIKASLIYQLIDHSYDLVYKALPKNKKSEIDLTATDSNKH